MQLFFCISAFEALIWKPLDNTLGSFDHYCIGGDNYKKDSTFAEDVPKDNFENKRKKLHRDLSFSRPFIGHPKASVVTHIVLSPEQNFALHQSHSLFLPYI